MATPDDSPTLEQSMRIITVAGCLAMVHYTCITCPVVTDFCREMGATEFQFGLLAGLPMILLIMQFVGAYLTDRIPRRKPYFMVLEISARLVWVPAAFLPLLFPQIPGSVLIVVFLGAVMVNGALSNMDSPLWFSWISDLVPRRILNRYWGQRQQYMTLVWTLALVAVAALTWLAKSLSARQMLPILVSIGCLAGIADILLFTWVREPPNLMNPDSHPLQVLLAPLRHREYRTLVVFSCAFSAAAMVGAAFMQIYVLDVLKLPVWKTTLIWCTAGLGAAVVAPAFGRLADRHGHRPVLLLCMLFKPMIAGVFLFVTAGNAFVVLSIAFFLDSMLNGGYTIAVNGYMLKMAPRVSRSMFIAALTALSGIAGGLGAILGGLILRHSRDFSACVFGMDWTNYHVVFLLSFILRALCIPLAAAVREPTSSGTLVVLNALVGQWPMRLIVFPVGLYRRFLSAEEQEETEGTGQPR